MNHTIRAEDWRYIHYRNGDAELHDERNDPNEWTNLVNKAEFVSKKAELEKWLPKVNHADIGGRKGAGAEKGMSSDSDESQPKTKRAARKNKKQQ